MEAAAPEPVLHLSAMQPKLPVGSPAADFAVQRIAGPWDLSAHSLDLLPSLLRPFFVDILVVAVVAENVPVLASELLPSVLPPSAHVLASVLLPASVRHP